MNKKKSYDYFDDFDYLPDNIRGEIIRKSLVRQIENLRDNFDFYKDYYRGVSDIQNYSIEEIVQKLPKLTKTVLRNIEPLSLLPKNIFSNIDDLPYVQKSTGGTTGDGVQIFYTKQDWENALYTHKRFLAEVLNGTNKKIIAYNSYNHGHIAGPVFSQAISVSGGLAINRSFNINDCNALKEIIKAKCNMIIAPPESSHKGGTLKSLLDEDAASGSNYINGDNIDIILTSSLPVTDVLIEELNELGIKLVLNFYGQTEIMPLAISCPIHPGYLHLSEGHTVVALVDHNFKPVKNGERGMIISGRINAFSGNNGVSHSTGIMNYISGDSAILITAACECGRKTKRICNINRELDIESKIESGCQLW